MLRLLPVFLVTLAVSALSVSCSSPPSQAEAKPDHFWIGDGIDGSRRMVISLSQQRIYYFKGGELVGASPISSGRENGMTKTGSFKIMQKDLDHRSTHYGSFIAADGTVVDNDVDARTDTPPPGTRFVGADMRYFMRITGAIGMHQGYLPGYPASHGCIRLPGKMAEIFFNETPLGTPIEVRTGPVNVPEDEALAILAQKASAKPQPEPQRTAVAGAQPAGTGSRKLFASSKTRPARQTKPAGPKPSKRWFGPRQEPARPVQRGETIYLYELSQMPSGR